MTSPSLTAPLPARPQPTDHLRAAAAEAAAMLGNDLDGRPVPLSIALARIGTRLGICRPGDHARDVLLAWTRLAAGERPTLTPLPPVLRDKPPPRASPKRDLIVEALRAGDRTALEVAERTGMAVTTVRSQLGYLVRLGRVTRNSAGVYGPVEGA